MRYPFGVFEGTLYCGAWFAENVVRRNQTTRKIRRVRDRDRSSQFTRQMVADRTPRKTSGSPWRNETRFCSRLKSGRTRFRRRLNSDDHSLSGDRLRRERPIHCC